MSTHRHLALTILILLLSFALPAAAQDEVAFDIDAQPLASALNAFGQQSRQDILFSSTIVEGKNAGPLRGNYLPDTALGMLLEDTGLAFTRTENGTILVNTRAAIESPPTSVGQAASQDFDEDIIRLIDVIVVRGSRNTDLRRLESDPLPFTVFDRDAIQQSNTNSVGEFLTRNLNTNTGANGAANSPSGALAGRGRSNVALRGLSDRETLILIDGRRVAENRTSGGFIRQTDINGIPLAAVERIEVLSSSASGIYGGGATGGVINIILKRDYQGFEVGLTHDTTTRSDYSESRVDISGGTTIGDNTSVNFSASYRDSTRLSVGERSLYLNARQQALANNPGRILGSRLLSSTGNIASPFTFLGPGPDLTLVGGGDLGSQTTHIPVGYPGVGSDGGAALIANAGTYNLVPSSTAQLGGGGNTLAALPESISFIGSVNHDFSSNLTGFVEANYSNSESSSPANTAASTYTVFGGSPGNPFNENVSVTLPIPTSTQFFSSEIESTRLGAGLTYEFVPNGWFLSGDLTWNQTEAQDRSSALFDSVALGADINAGVVNPFADSGVDESTYASYFFDDVSTETPSKTTLTSFVLRTGGTVPLTLPGGDIIINANAEYRDEKYDAVTAEQFTYNPFSGILAQETIVTPAQIQRVNSVYVETLLPIFSPESEVPGLHLLEVQLSARYDKYDLDTALRSLNDDPTFMPGSTAQRTDFQFSETTPTYALKYSPVEGLTVRGSYAEGFLPPQVTQISEISTPNFTPGFFFSIFGTGDPLRGGELLGSNNGLGGVNVFGGGSNDLRPERSESVSAGIIIEPDFAEGLRLSVDWTRIEKTDAITQLVSFDPNDAAELITLRPDRVTRADPAPGDPFSVGPITALSSRLLNFASQTIEAIDYSLDYRFDTENVGEFEFRFDVTRNRKSELQNTPSADIRSVLGFGDFLKTRGTAAIQWRRDGWGAQWAAQYYSSYDIDPDGFGAAGRILSQGSGSIASQTYHDVIVSYQFDDNSRWDLLNNTSFELSAINIFDEDPPFDATQLSTTGVSVYGDQRLSRLRLAIRKSF